MSETKVDIGNLKEFPTGAKRQDKTGKGRFDLIPYDGLVEIAKVFEAGCVHGERNWEKGIPLANYLSSAIRHLHQEASGKTDEPHAAQAAWNILCYIATREWVKQGLLPKELAENLSIPDSARKILAAFHTNLNVAPNPIVAAKRAGTVSPPVPAPQPKPKCICCGQKIYFLCPKNIHCSVHCSDSCEYTPTPDLKPTGRVSVCNCFGRVCTCEDCV